jgi:glyoxylase-like metal-dependent hydrolase (beta-lactamase superfamily II)
MPKVSVLKPGSLVRDESGNILDARSSAVLVTSGSRKIIVDTGLMGEDGLIIDALARKGLRPQDIDTVINTHPHPDHCGNNHLFSHALRLMPADGETIAPGVWAMATPGHTLDSISIVVEATKSSNVMASVLVIAGDALPTLNNFLRACHRRCMWTGISCSSMSRIIEIADIVVPGHDRPFSVAEGKYIQLDNWTSAFVQGQK